MKFGIGQSAKRTEDPVLLTGQGRYTDDVKLSGAAHGWVVRSPMAHAAITRLDVEAARRAPGVLSVLTGAELAEDGVGDLPCIYPLKNADGSDRADTPWPILAKGRVRYVGNPVAFIVAGTLEQAKDAADLIDMEFDELPVEVDTLAAAQDGAAQIWDHIPGNLAFDFAQGDQDGVEAAFTTADRVTKVQLVNNRLVSNAMEPRAAVAEIDAATGRLTMHLPTQGPFFCFDQLVGMLGLEKEDLRLVTGNVGGGFGTKAFLYPEAALTLWAAKRLGRAVRWTGERSEIFLSDVQGRDNVTIAELAMDADGTFRAMRATTYAAMGAYLSNFGPLIPTDAAVGMYTGLYRIPLCHVAVKGVITNTVPVDAYRGAGRPEAAYVVERLVDVAAREIGLGPDEIRRRNLPGPDEMPHTMGMGPVIDSGDFPGLMAEAMEKADWSGFETRRAASEARGKLRGIGMATYVERCAGGGGSPAWVRFTYDDRIRLLSGTMDSGQGHAIAFKQILSERLGVDAERIDLVQGDTDNGQPGFTGGSKSIPVGGASVQIAADKVIEKGREIAGHLLEVSPADISFEDGTFSVAGTDRAVDLFEAARAARDPARLPAGVEPGLDAEHDHIPEAATFPNGCHICEMEVDPETGVINIQNYTVVDDFGLALNPMLLLGQVHGGIGQGLGQAWTEHTVYDPESGQLLSGSFMDYQMPRADDMPNYNVHFRHVRCQTNPLGVKGAGEAGAIGAPPAFVNALVDALYARTGDSRFDMPATPLRVWQAIQP